MTIDTTSSDLFDPHLPPKSLPNGTGPVDLARIEAAVAEILAAIGEDPGRDGLLETPARVARMYAEVTSGLREVPEHHLDVTFEAGHDEMVDPLLLLARVHARVALDRVLERDERGLDLRHCLGLRAAHLGHLVEQLAELRVLLLVHLPERPRQDGHEPVGPGRLKPRRNAGEVLHLVLLLSGHGGRGQ